MPATQRTIMATRTGAIVMSGLGVPRCLQVLDTQGRSVTGASTVDLATAFRTLNALCTTGSPEGAAGRDASPLR